MWDPHIVRGFDAELYLRLIGERMLVARSEQATTPQRPMIAEAATALVAVGRIDAPRAENVLDDYSLATALRHDPRFRRRTTTAARSDPSSGKPLGPRRVVPCERVIEQPHATLQVRWVSLSEDATSVAVTWHPDRSGPWNGNPPRVTIADDRGNAENADFGGMGANEGWIGRLTTARPLARDTAWIELDGTRLELTVASSGFDATIERLPAQDPAHRYLWRRIAEPRELAENGIEPAIEALLAAGAVAVDDPLLDQVRTVLEAMQRRPGPTLLPAHELARMPEPWRSLLARQGRYDGPTGSVVLGAVSPVFDGFSVAVLDLRSEREWFRVEVDVAPGLDIRQAFEWSVRPLPIAWWARDDLGNHYLGRRGTWDSASTYGFGVVGFWPGLDPRASRLEIMPTAESMRAVIGCSLRSLGGDAAAAGGGR